jgi:hypothetical protein
MSNGDEIPGDIPVIGTKVHAGSSGEETFTIEVGGTSKLRVKTHDKRLRITVTSGRDRVSIPLQKDNWSLKIDEDV